MSRAAAAVLLATLMLLSLAPGALPTGTAPVQPDEVGHHIVTHVRVSEPNGHPHAVMAATNSNGDVVFYAYVEGNRLFASDGQSNGVPNAAKKFSPYIGSGWFRLDAVLDGDTYTLTLEGRQSITARTFVHASEGAVVQDPRPLLGDEYEDVFWSRTRVDLGDGSHETTFATPLGPDAPWTPHVTGGFVTIHDNWSGHESVGAAEIFERLEEGVAYLSADLADVGHTYGLEASVSIWSLLPPLGNAWLAGISGDPDAPTVHWALVIDLPPVVNEALSGSVFEHNYALYLEHEDGSRTHLTSWNNNGESWHALEVRIDETSASLQVSWDGQDLGTFTELALASATTIATGDLDPRAPTMDEQFFVDDLAIYPLAEGGPLGVARSDDVAIYERVAP